MPRERITAHPSHYHSKLRDIKETVKECGFESGRQDKISFRGLCCVSLKEPTAESKAEASFGPA